MREPREAVEQYRQALKIDPTFQSAHCGLAIAEIQAGWPDRGLARLELLEAAVPVEVPVLQGIKAYTLGVLDRAKDARSIVRRLRGTSAYLPPEFIALGHIGIGETDVALDWLERACKV
ncbi:MAG: tetratricopeptide repeat protein [Gemmatimonadetes bacterium]|nr:tetratricopeptide repeat protein [Gemmatimonadota bacterium]